MTKLKRNALYSSVREIDIPDTTDTGILIDEIIELRYGNGKELAHIATRIAYWDEQKKKVLVFLTNNTDFEAQIIIVLSIQTRNATKHFSNIGAWFYKIKTPYLIFIGQ